MTNLYLDTSTLTAKAEELEELNSRLFELIQALNDSEELLASMWEGPAKESFRRAYRCDSMQMKAFYNAIIVYIFQLRNIIEAYKRIEAINEELSRTRSYGGCGCGCGG